MDVEAEVLSVLRSVLNVGGGASAIASESRLLGSVPELDSMAVVAILTSIEERLGITFADDEVDGSSFASVQSLVALVQTKVQS